MAVVVGLGEHGVELGDPHRSAIGGGEFLEPVFERSGVGAAIPMGVDEIHRQLLALGLLHEGAHPRPALAVGRDAGRAEAELLLLREGDHRRPGLDGFLDGDVTLRVALRFVESEQVLRAGIVEHRQFGGRRRLAMSFHHRDEFIARRAAALAGPRVPPRAAELFFGFRTVARPSFLRGALGGALGGQARERRAGGSRQQKADGISSAQGHAA